MVSLRSFDLLRKVRSHAEARPDQVAITDIPNGLSITYPAFLQDIVSLGGALLSGSETDLDEARVVVLCEKGYLVALCLVAVWAAGGLAVPILPSLPIPEQSYIVENSESTIILCDEKNKQRSEALAKIVVDAGGRCQVKVISLSDIRSETKLDSADLTSHLDKVSELEGDRRAMMLYTSGTTGRPKGVVTRHSALSSQVSTVAETWQWTEKDNLLHVLPLNHLHGVVVALLPTIWAGASVEMWEKFDGPAIWKRWINEAKDEPISMFFGVPTVYSRLIAAHAALSPEEQKIASTASGSLRLQVSGSAPLPESLKRTWEAPGGVGGGMILLERYGMTETGIIAGTGWEHIHRVKGHVGWPLRNVELRLWDEEKGEVVTEPDRPGEVQVIGPGIFNEYWKLPEVTVKEFKDGYFKTGDVAVYSSEAESKGQIRILGRNSTDIIKSGGEKISAVEIERAILELEGTKDVAVVGVEDVEWGQVVGVCLVTTKSDTTVDSLRKALRPMIAAYKLPRKVKLYEGEIPRNNMGKVNKKKLVLEAFPAATVP